MVIHTFALAIDVVTALAPFSHSVMAVLVRVPEPSPATVMTVLGGAAGAIHFARVAVRHRRSKKPDA